MSSGMRASVIVGTILILAVLLGYLFFHKQSASIVDSVRGIYFVVALGNASGDVATPDNIQNDISVQLKDPYLNGVYVKDVWSKVEPMQGKFDWTELDAEVKLLEAAGKKIAISVRAGDESPAWLYSEGVPAISATVESKGNCVPDKMPVAWDPTFLKEWTAFVVAFGAHYANDPHIVEVKITGINEDSDETRLPLPTPGGGGGKSVQCPELDQPSLWQAAGYTSDKITGAWEEIVNAFASAFPNQALTIMGQTSAGYDDATHSYGLLGNVFRPYGASVLGKRFIVAENGWSPNHLDDGILAFATSTGNAIGWQQGVNPFHCTINGQSVSLKSGACTFYEGLKEAFATALPTHPVYLELLANFANDPKNEPLIKEAYDQLTTEPGTF